MNDCAKKFSNLKFVRFIASLVVSCFVLVLCCFGMAGYFPKVEPNYFTSLITLVVGVWIGYGSSKTANPPLDKSVESVNSSTSDKPDEEQPLLIDKNSPINHV
jgi:heme O synthase-like polyprenyltransferase